MKLRHAIPAVLFLTLAPAAAASDLSKAIQNRIDLMVTAPDSAPGDATTILAGFYAERAYEPMWVEDGSIGERGRLIYRVLAEADRHGLFPEEYRAAEIAALQGSTDTKHLAELDINLGFGLMRYAQDVRNGRVGPSRHDPELFLAPKQIDPTNVLASALAAPDLRGWLDALPPQTGQYARTVEALERYRDLAARGGWETLPDGPTLKPGMRDARTPILRSRLVKGGDLANAETTDPELYDPAMEEAVRRFQYRHGLEQDGAVGKNTRAAFNVPVEERIETLIINLERRRWLPDDLGERYIFVNMAGFELKVVEKGDTVFDTRIIVGTPFHRTPVFTGNMTYLVFNPYWHITPSIARNEILPAVKKSPSYLKSKNIRVFSDWSADATEIDPWTVDWSKVTPRSLSYKFRQDSGPSNALGRVKFMFPNGHSIYLHDTPARQLFAQARRSFSHGCIRVQHPLELAALLLRETPDWSRERIDETVAAGERVIVNLPRSIPVYLTYLTNWVNKDGSIYFREDIYGRDKRLKEVLFPARV